MVRSVARWSLFSNSFGNLIHSGVLIDGVYLQAHSHGEYIAVSSWVERSFFVRVFLRCAPLLKVARITIFVMACYHKMKLSLGRARLYLWRESAVWCKQHSSLLLISAEDYSTKVNKPSPFTLSLCQEKPRTTGRCCYTKSNVIDYFILSDSLHSPLWGARKYKNRQCSSRI